MRRFLVSFWVGHKYKAYLYFAINVNHAREMARERINKKYGVRTGQYSLLCEPYKLSWEIPEFN